MTCSVGEPRIIERGSIEYIDISVTATVELDNQSVAFSLEPYPYEWLTATWQGNPGLTRTASVLVSDADLPDTGTFEIYVKVTDSPEVPIFHAGTGYRSS